MPSFPTDIVDLDPNENGSTPVNESYMNTRDDELIALEKSLGTGLVSSAALASSGWSLSDFVTAKDGYLWLGHAAASYVKVGDAEDEPEREPVATLELMAANPRLRLTDTTDPVGTNFEIRSEATRFELTRYTDGGAAYRMMVIELSQKEDSIYIDDSGRVGIGIDGAAPPSAPLDVNGDTIRLRTANSAPAARTEGNLGDIRWTSDAIYVKTAEGPNAADHQWGKATLVDVFSP